MFIMCRILYANKTEHNAPTTKEVGPGEQDSWSSGLDLLHMDEGRSCVIIGDSFQ